MRLTMPLDVERRGTAPLAHCGYLCRLPQFGNLTCRKEQLDPGAEAESSEAAVILRAPPLLEQEIPSKPSQHSARIENSRNSGWFSFNF